MIEELVLEGYGTFKNCTRTVKVIMETKTLFIVSWGNSQIRFSKKTGYQTGNRDRWSGWRVARKV